MEETAFDKLRQTVEATEFSFRIVYKLNDETHLIEDSIKVEFEKFRFNVGTMEDEPVWHAHSTSGEGDIIKALNGNTNIHFNLGSGAYYAGEPVKLIAGKPHISVGNTQYEIEEANEVLEKEGITLASWNIAEPIRNA